MSRSETTYTVDVTIMDTGCSGEFRYEARAKLAGKHEYRQMNGTSASGAARAAVEWLIKDLWARDYRTP